MSRAAVYVDLIDADGLLTAVRAQSVRAVARQAGCAFPYLSDLCHGHQRRVRLDLAARIEDACRQPRGTYFRLDPEAANLITPYLPKDGS